MNARGDAVVLWRPEGQAVQVASRTGWRGAWRVRALPSGPAALGDPDYAGFASPQVALAFDGAAAVLWATQERSGSAVGPGFMPGRYVVRGARRASRGGAWQESPALALEPVVDLGWTVLRPRLAVDAAGDAAALWIVATPESVQTALAEGAIQAARRSGDGPWSGPVTLADPAGLGDVALAANGRAAVVWQERAASYGFLTPITLALGEPGASGWSVPQAGPAWGRQPRVAINARGDVLVGWGSPFVPDDPAREQFVAHAALRPAGGAWGAGGTFPSSGQTLFADLHPALDEAGRGYMAWDTGSTSVEAMVHAVAGSASGWPRSGRLSGYGGGAQIVAGPDGTALLFGGGPEEVLTPTGVQIGGFFAFSYDSALPVRLSASARGLWDARARAVRWTVRVRNSGRIRAQGVTVSIPITSGARLLASRPKPQPHPGQLPRWRLGTLPPGASRSLVAVIRPPKPLSGVTWIYTKLSAVAMGPKEARWQAKTPSP
jgi:hypothetical protein